MLSQLAEKRARKKTVDEDVEVLDYEEDLYDVHEA